MRHKHTRNREAHRAEQVSHRNERNPSDQEGLVKCEPRHTRRRPRFTNIIYLYVQTQPHSTDASRTDAHTHTTYTHTRSAHTTQATYSGEATWCQVHSSRRSRRRAINTVNVSNMLRKNTPSCMCVCSKYANQRNVASISCACTCRTGCAFSQRSARSLLRCVEARTQAT